MTREVKAQKLLMSLVLMLMPAFASQENKVSTSTSKTGCEHRRNTLLRCKKVDASSGLLATPAQASRLSPYSTGVCRTWVQAAVQTGQALLGQSA